MGSAKTPQTNPRGRYQTSTRSSVRYSPAWLPAVPRVLPRRHAGLPRRLADRLAGAPVAALFTSDLARAAETAGILGEALGLEPVPSPAWREIHLGDLEGEDSLATVRAQGELISAAARAEGPLGRGGESFREFQARIVAGYEQICRDHADEIAELAERPPSTASNVATDINISRRNGETPAAIAVNISGAIYRSKLVAESSST